MRFVVLLLASIFLASGAFAQTSVQQSYPLVTTATGLYGQANGATSCNTVSQTAAQDTVTITPPAGQYVYIWEITIDNQMDATGVTQFGTISATNITGAPFWSFGSALSTVQGIAPSLVEIFPSGLKSTTAGTAVTLVPSATQSAHNTLCVHVAASFGP